MTFSTGCTHSPIQTQFRAHDEPILGIALSQDGADIATASTDGSIAVWDRATSRQVATLRAHDDWVTDIAFDPSRPELASAGKDGQVIFWSTETWEQRGTPIALSQPVWALAYSSDGSSLALALEDGSISLRDATPAAEIAILAPRAKRTNSVAFSPDGTRLIATHAGTTPLDISATVWDLSSHRQLAVLTGHGPAALALGTSEPDLAQELLNHGVTWGSVNDATYTPDGTLIATAGEDGTLRLWDASTWEALATIAVPQTSLFASSFSHSGQTLFAAGSLGNGGVWETVSLEQIFSLPEGGVVMNDAAYTPDSQSIVAGYYDGMVRIWAIPAPSHKTE